MSYQEVPHAAVNVLMRWVRQHGQHVIRLHTCPCLAGWSGLSEWAAHVEVQGAPPIHICIKRNGSKFVIYEPDGALCPVCDAHRGPARGPHNAVELAGDLTIQDSNNKSRLALQSNEQQSAKVCGLAHA